MSLPVQIDWVTQLQPHFQAPISSVKSRTIGSLWAGYGSVNSLEVHLKGQSSPVALVVKDVRPPRGSGVSHERKVASYRVEEHFYKHIAPDLISVTDLGLPRPLVIKSSPAGFQFVLTDLREDFPHPARDCLDGQQVRTVLSWLATYHAYFWERPTPSGLQQQGSYWYLDTRREEFELMDRSWVDLKAVAERVDACLKLPGESEFMTCIHGDVKDENILFSADGTRCALYDFQYTGRSYGVRDVVYLFASSVDSSDLDDVEDEYLSYYHSELLNRLALKGKAGIEAAMRYRPDVMRRHVDLALLDYVRFMAGWGIWGSGSGWAVRRAKALLPKVQQLL
ncbi:hypothetical protein Vafri_3944 [Volvox africanus]|uniref:CHK kinase-like domain-containing protein n=1 Tax=Volvox africanus TaxID=51714 RepID=A0A8J4AU92_9CHLO|nr:hypothetical protein Vafri_3944 [Volvox africanus]